mgnify:CR=1 FL=1
MNWQNQAIRNYSKKGLFIGCIWIPKCVTLISRLDAGWPIEKAFNTPVKKRRMHNEA